MSLRHPRTTLFPYTTLFRSRNRNSNCWCRRLRECWSWCWCWLGRSRVVSRLAQRYAGKHSDDEQSRSEEHTSELQSQFHLVCRLLLEKKKTSGAAWTEQRRG